MFRIYLIINSELCHLQHKLIGFYNRDEKCLLPGTNWVFKESSLRFVFKGLSRLPVDGTPVPKNAGVDSHHKFYFVICILPYFIEYICWLIYRMLTTVFRTAQHVPFLCHAKPIHYSSTHQNLIYSKVSTRSPLFFSPMRATFPTYTIFLDLIKLIIQDKKHTSWSSKLWHFFSASCHVPPMYAKIFSCETYFQNHSAYVLP